MTKIYYGRDLIGRFTCDGKKRTFKQRLVLYTKYYLIQSAKVCIFLWLLMGAFQAGIRLMPQQLVYAEKEVVKEVRLKAPVMERIAFCESGGQHIEKKTGQVIMRSNTNKTVDVGKYQINSVWFKKATELGLDITKEVDNEKFAYWLYENRGTNDWVYSRDCWSR